ncbi:Myosin-2 heavy chain [Gossypium australe]|uniref:Myosin-2 heavy chain n=1 Tax=Gossypium australe TaxID=47621 RepID=A0A5B6VKR9_9ROSI|nr:Myosin-2 heavy chain [Gossypium australe]
MMIFKFGKENILANFQLEVPINYYKRQIWILTETKKFLQKAMEFTSPIKNCHHYLVFSWNFIHTLKNLRIRRVASDRSCPRCRNVEEDSNHVFRQCPTTTKTWQNLSLSWVINTNIQDLWEWLTWVFTMGDNKQCCLFCCAAWT